MASNILTYFFPNSLKELLYFASAPIGIFTYSLVVMFGPELVVPILVSITAGLAVNGLFLAIYMYTPIESRRRATKIDKLKFIFVYYFVLSVATLLFPTSYDGMFVILYCGLVFLLMFKAINSESAIKLAVASVFVGGITPLISLSIVYIPTNFIMSAFGISTFFLIYKSIEGQDTGSHASLTGNIALAGLMQFSLFSFALIDLFLYELFDHDTLAIYLVKWRIIYGLVVFLYAKVMIKLAFDDTAGYLGLNIKVTSFLYIIALILTNFNQYSVALDGLLGIIAILINQVSVIVRTFIKIGLTFLFTTLYFLLTLTVLFFVLYFLIPNFSEGSDPRFIFALAALAILAPSILILPVIRFGFSR